MERQLLIYANSECPALRLNGSWWCGCAPHRTAQRRARKQARGIERRQRRIRVVHDQRNLSADIARLNGFATLHYTPGDRQTYEAYLRANSAFHLALVQCSRNGHLEAIVMSALDKHQRPLYLGLDVAVDSTAATAEHFEIIDAVRSHDRARAHDLMVQHISHAEERITTALRQAGF